MLFKLSCCFPNCMFSVLSCEMSNWSRNHAVCTGERTSLFQVIPSYQSYLNEANTMGLKFSCQTKDMVEVGFEPRTFH